MWVTTLPPEAIFIMEPSGGHFRQRGLLGNRLASGGHYFLPAAKPAGQEAPNLSSRSSSSSSSSSSDKFLI